MTKKALLKLLANLPDDGSYLSHLWHNSATKRALAAELEKYKEKPRCPPSTPAKS